MRVSLFKHRQIILFLCVFSFVYISACKPISERDMPEPPKKDSATKPIEVVVNYNTGQIDSILASVIRLNGKEKVQKNDNTADEQRRFQNSLRELKDQSIANEKLIQQLLEKENAVKADPDTIIIIQKQTADTAAKRKIENNIRYSVYDITDNQSLKVWLVNNQFSSHQAEQILVLNNMSRKCKLAIDTIIPVTENPGIRGAIFKYDTACINPSTQAIIKCKGLEQAQEFYITGQFFKSRGSSSGWKSKKGKEFKILVIFNQK